MLEHKLYGAPETERRWVVGKRKNSGNPEELRLDLADNVLNRALAVRPIGEVGKDYSAAHASEESNDTEVLVDVLGAPQDGLHLPLVAVGVCER